MALPKAPIGSPSEDLLTLIFCQYSLKKYDSFLKSLFQAPIGSPSEDLLSQKFLQKLAQEIIL
jgi:hypothetical protein